MPTATKTSTAKAAKDQQRLEADAAQWRALEPHLPEILRRGVIALLNAPTEPTEPPAKETEATATTSTPAPQLSSALWQQMPNADLLDETSELAIDEKLRRSFECIEIFNNENDTTFIPHPKLLAQIADVADAAALNWLAVNEDYTARYKQMLKDFEISADDVPLNNSQLLLTLSGGATRKPVRHFFKWSEADYGGYQWDS